MDPNKVVTLNRAMSELPLWGISPPERIRALHSGLTNRSYLLETPNRSYVLRLNNNNALKLGISRRNEYRALQAIADEDFAPETVYICPNYSYLVSRHIVGTSFAEQAPSADELNHLSHIVDWYQSDLAEQLAPINYAQQLQAYYQTALDCNAIDDEAAAAWKGFFPKIEAIEANIPPRKFCHGDLSPSNIIRHKKQLKIIDWEYACLGHPLMDRLSAGLHIDEATREYTQLQEVLTWLHKLRLLIIPHYPKLPAEDGRSHEAPADPF